MAVHGADIQGAGGMLFSVHTKEDVDQMEETFDKTLGDMAGAGLL
jgi:hypothetical protein